MIQVRSTEELLDVVQLLSGQPVPAGKRLGIIGNAGGPGILAADATADTGLEVPELSPATQDALRAAAPGLASARNPIDLGAAADADAYEQTIRALLACGEVDAVVVIHAATSVSDPPSVASAIRRAARAGGGRTTVAAVLIGTDADGALTDPTDMVHPLPPYAFPESAVRAIGHAAAYGAWRRRPPGIRAATVRNGHRRRPDRRGADARRAPGRLLARPPGHRRPARRPRRPVLPDRARRHRRRGGRRRPSGSAFPWC